MSAPVVGQVVGTPDGSGSVVLVKAQTCCVRLASGATRVYLYEELGDPSRPAAVSRPSGRVSQPKGLPENRAVQSAAPRELTQHVRNNPHP